MHEVINDFMEICVGQCPPVFLSTTSSREAVLSGRGSARSILPANDNQNLQLSFSFDSQMSVCFLGGHPATGSSEDETFLEEIGLVNILQSRHVFGYGRSERVQARGPPPNISTNALKYLWSVWFRPYSSISSFDKELDVISRRMQSQFSSSNWAKSRTRRYKRLAILGVPSALFAISPRRVLFRSENHKSSRFLFHSAQAPPRHNNTIGGQFRICPGGEAETSRSVWCAGSA